MAIPTWLVDPYGFTVLRYAPGFDPGDLRTGLARLLKIEIDAMNNPASPAPPLKGGLHRHFHRISLARGGAGPPA